MTSSESVATLGRGDVGEVGSEQFNTMSGRTDLWQACLRAANKRPLTGYGYNAFFTPQNMDWIAKENYGWAAATAHSGYIGTLLGVGYIGAVSLVLILFLSVKNSVRLTKRNPEYAFAAAVFVWLCCMLITEEDLLGRPFFQVFVWMILLAKVAFLPEER